MRDVDPLVGRVLAAERECDQLRALLRQVRNLVRIFDINTALHLIATSGLLDGDINSSEGDGQ